jgi:hypothetical protein
MGYWHTIEGPLPDTRRFALRLIPRKTLCLMDNCIERMLEKSLSLLKGDNNIPVHELDKSQRRHVRCCIEYINRLEYV